MPENPFLSVKKNTPPAPGGGNTPVPGTNPGTIDPVKVKPAEQSQADMILNRSQRQGSNEDVKVPVYIKALKILSITLIIVVLAISSFLSLDLAEGNKYLGILGYEENTRTSFEKLKALRFQLEGEVNKLKQEKSVLEEKISKKIYSENTETIQAIKEKQITWFDTFDENGEFQIGLFDLPNHLGEFINQQNLDDILGEKRNQIRIENITANRSSLSFNFEASNLFGKVFNLTQEFITFINASPKLEGVSISSFSRSENDLGWDSMTLGVNAKLQAPDAEDPNDNEEIYKQFSDWVQASNKSNQTNTSTASNTASSGSSTQGTNNETNPSTSPVRLTPR